MIHYLPITDFYLNQIRDQDSIGTKDSTAKNQQGGDFYASNLILSLKFMLLVMVATEIIPVGLLYENDRQKED